MGELEAFTGDVVIGDEYIADVVVVVVEEEEEVVVVDDDDDDENEEVRMGRIRRGNDPVEGRVNERVS